MRGNFSKFEEKNFVKKMRDSSLMDGYPDQKLTLTRLSDEMSMKECKLISRPYLRIPHPPIELVFHNFDCTFLSSVFDIRVAGICQRS